MFCGIGEYMEKMKTRPDVELLAPAGSAAGLRAVISAGCDACYIGGSKFGARAYAENPGEEELCDLIDYAHIRGVKVYLTVNTLLKEEELSELPEYIRPYYERGLDAVLVQDFGVLRTVRSFFPDLPLHASTQMTVTGPQSASFLAEQGISRVVHAREMTLDELREIHEKSGLEVEAFIHGALCVCYSGQCLLSSQLGGRSGNRGRCAQPCRLRYESKDGEGQRVKGDLLSPKDLCLLDRLPDLIESGVSSLKIEGRMKQPEYAAGVVSVYRKYLDLYFEKGRQGYTVKEADRKILLTLFNRDGFTDGYLNRHNGPEMMAFRRNELSQAEEKRRADLYAAFREKYVEKEKKIPLEGTVCVRCGCDLSLRVTARAQNEEYICTFDQKAQKASARPLSAERIKEQIGKTGETDFYFEKLSVDTDGASFAPMGALNQLRRAALSGLREKLLARFRRSSMEAGAREDGEQADKFAAKFGADGEQADAFAEKFREGMDLPAGDSHESADPAAKKEDGTSIFVRVSAEDQLAAVLKNPDISGIYIDSMMLFDVSGRSQSPVEKAERYVRRIVQTGKEPWIALPYIERSGKCSVLYDSAERLFDVGLKGFLAGSFESAAALIERGLARYVRTDAGIYTWNSEAKQFVREAGISLDTVPVELNRREIASRDNRGSECIVYGHLPLMVTAQCLKKNTSGCDKGSRLLMMQDRKRRKFPVKCVCVFCYNILYNPVRLSLLSEVNALTGAGIDSVRLVFTTESGEETEDLVKKAVMAFKGGIPVGIEGELTKGQFNRGVE